MSLPKVGDREMRAFERARQAACVGYPISCQRSTLPEVTRVWQKICQNKLGRASPDHVAKMYLIFLYSEEVLKDYLDTPASPDETWGKCLFDLSMAMGMEQQERTNDEIRSLGGKSR